jgi:hypothetical protein
MFDNAMMFMINIWRYVMMFVINICDDVCDYYLMIYDAMIKNDIRWSIWIM